MKKMVIVVALLLIMSALAAKDIRVTGHGSSEEEARNNAVTSLSSMVFGTSVVSETTTTLSSSTGGNTSSSFSSYSSGLTFGSFLGLQYSDATKDKSGYTVDAIIPDGSYGAYEAKLSESIKTIKSIRSQLENSKATMEQKKNLYLNLLSALGEYNNCRQVLVFMQHGTQIQELDLDITLQSVATEYQSLLIDEANELQKSYGTVDSNALNAMIAENRRMQEELNAQKNEAMAQAEAQRIASINEQMRMMLERTGQLTFIVQGASFSSAVRDLMDAISGYREISSQYDNMLSDEINRIEREYQTEKRALENKAYLSAELSGGKPTATAKAYREMDLEDLRITMEKRRSEVEKLITDGFKDALQASYDTYAKALLDIQSTTFTGSVSGGDFSVVIGDYDGEGFFWPFTLESTVLPKAFDIRGIKISYKTLTGLDPVTGTSDRNAFNEYITRVDQMERSYLSSFTDYYDFSVRFTVTINPENGKVFLDILSVDFLQGGKIASSISSYKAEGDGKWVQTSLKFPKIEYDFISQDMNADMKAKTMVAEEERKRVQDIEDEKARMEYWAQQQAKAEESNIRKEKNRRIIGVNPGNGGMQMFADIAFSDAEAPSPFAIVAGFNFESMIGSTFYWGISPTFFMYEVYEEDEIVTKFALLAGGGISLGGFASIGFKFGLGFGATYSELYARIRLYEEPAQYDGDVALAINGVVGIAHDGFVKSDRFYVGAQYVF